MSILSRVKRTFKSAVSKVKSGASKVASIAKQGAAAVTAPILSSAGRSTLPKPQPSYEGLNNVTKDAFTPTKYSGDLLASGLKSGGLKVIQSGSTGGLYQPSRSSSKASGTSLGSDGLSASGLQYNSYGGTSPVPSPKTIGAGSRSSNSSLQFAGTSSPGLRFSEGSGLNINAASLSSSPSVSLPSAPSYANVSSVTNAGLAGAATEGQTYDPASGLFVNTPVDTNATSEEERRKKDFEDLMDMAPQKESVYEDREVQRQQREVRERQQEVNNYTAQLNNIVAKRDADLLKVRGIGSVEGVTEAVYGGQAATIEREAAIRALPVQAQVAAAQGNLQLANDYLDELITVKRDIIDSEYQYNKMKFEAISGFLTKEEKIRMDKMTKEEDRAYDQAQKNLDLQNEWAKTAIENGQNHLVSRIHALSAGDPNFQAKLGQIIAGIQDKDVGSGYGTQDETVQTYATLLAQGKISLSNVPQSIRNAVVLASNGIITKPLSDTAVKEITQTQSAIENLGALKTVVQNNLQFIGPISGLARFNPYSDARQAQAEVDRVRQVVGKALEGGVLRKEDEEKYKKILATLSDTPETAIYKIDSLIGQLERDLSLYQENQQLAGRYVGETNVPDVDTLRVKYDY